MLRWRGQLELPKAYMEKHWKSVVVQYFSASHDVELASYKAFHLADGACAQTGCGAWYVRLASQQQILS